MNSSLPWDTINYNSCSCWYNTRSKEKYNPKQRPKEPRFVHRTKKHEEIFVKVLTLKALKSERQRLNTLSIVLLQSRDCFLYNRP